MKPCDKQKLFQALITAGYDASQMLDFEPNPDEQGGFIVVGCLTKSNEKFTFRHVLPVNDRRSADQIAADILTELKHRKSQPKQGVRFPADQVKSQLDVPMRVRKALEKAKSSDLHITSLAITDVSPSRNPDTTILNVVVDSEYLGVRRHIETTYNISNIYDLSEATDFSAAETRRIEAVADNIVAGLLRVSRVPVPAAIPYKVAGTMFALGAAASSVATLALTGVIEFAKLATAAGIVFSNPVTAVAATAVFLVAAIASFGLGARASHAQTMALMHK